MSEAAKQVLGRIKEICKPPTYVAGDRRLRVIAAVDGHGDPGPFLKALDSMPVGALHALTLADSIEETAAALTIPKPERRPMVEWQPVDLGEPADPEFQLAQVRAARDALRSRADGAEACENATGGGA